MKLDITLTAQRAREMEAEQPTMVEGIVKKALHMVRACVDEDNWEMNPGRIKLCSWWGSKMTSQEWLEVQTRLQELGYNVWFIGTIRDENGNISYKEVDVTVAKDWECIVSWRDESLNNVIEDMMENGRSAALYYSVDESQEMVK